MIHSENEKNTVADKEFNLEQYLTGGVENIVKSALRATLKNPKESAFMMRYAIASKEASQKRAAAEARGVHIPPFLIASITSSCNSTVPAVMPDTTMPARMNNP